MLLSMLHVLLASFFIYLSEGSSEGRLNTLGSTFQRISNNQIYENKNDEATLSPSLFECAKHSESCSYVLKTKNGEEEEEKVEDIDLDEISSDTEIWKKTETFYGEWHTGDLIGGLPEVGVGRVSDKEECYAICMMKIQNNVQANGVTVDAHSGRNCYCEFGMNQRDTTTAWKSTFIRRR